MTDTTAIVLVEHVLWTPDDAWTDALGHLADRFKRVAPLDVDAVLARPTFAEQVEAVATWAADEAGANADQELGRWFDEHLSLHVRPAPAVTRAVRALAASGPVHLVSALPARPAESIIRHAGCWRSVAELHGDIRSADALAEILAAHPAAALYANPDATPVPGGTTVHELLAPVG